MISYRKVPRPNPHQVIKIEFNYQPTLRIDLKRVQQLVWDSLLEIDVVTFVNMGFPCWVTIVAWSQSRDTTF